VAARSRGAAEDALELIQVDYEPLRPVVDVREAIKPSSATLFDELGTNLAWQGSLQYGDIEAAFKSADRVVKENLKIHRYSSTPLEPFVVIASYDAASKRLTVWVTAQVPEVIYDGVILVLKGVSITCGEGKITTLLGANGAGKTTTLKAVSGLLRSERGEVTKGSVELAGQRIDHMRPHEIVQKGIVQVFEGRRVFEHLTAEENLIAGAHIVPERRRIDEHIERVYQYFPRIKERRQQQSGYLSGGEQQMLVIGRALMSEPKVILLDEPSLGLAPLVVRKIFQIIREINAEGTTIFLVEQNAHMALGVAHRAYVLQTGRVIKSDKASVLLEDPDVKKAYLGG